MTTESSSPHRLQPPHLATLDLGFVGPSPSEQLPPALENTTATTRSPSSTKISLSPPPASNGTNIAMHSIRSGKLGNSVHPSSLQPSSSPPSSSQPPQRKSSRIKTSTLIYVDGHAVKKDNNYVVNGTEYVYGGVASDQERPPQRKKAAAGPKAAPKPRIVTALEQGRLDKKQELQTSIQEKAPARAKFLKDQLPVLTPFLEPKVLQLIRNAPSVAAPAVHESPPMYLQPDAIMGEMRDYQLAGLNWMSKMYSKNVGMILGDEMGLGKTLQTISLVCHLKEVHEKSGPSLIVCPLSVLTSWSAEIAKWAPSLKFLRLHSSNPESLDASNFAEYDMVVTTYEMIKAPALRTVWSRQQFNLLVLDEGHRIKGHETLIAQAVKKVHCENRVILTGTPLANNLVELWSLLNFLVPDVFTTKDPFAEAFDLTLNSVDPVRLEQAHHLLKVFMLRRLKAEVEKLMPKKIETKVICPLSNTQIWWYKAILLKDLNVLARGEKVNAKLLNNLIMQLRKVCVHPYLFPDAEDIENTTMENLIGSSGKLTVLDMLLRSLYEKGHRVVLFSQFTSVLDILEDYSNLRGWNYCRFDGGTSRAKRNYVVNSFNAPESDKFLFLMSTRAGGMGLNLQTADTCILFDSDWNPQPDIQAMARVHRLGQTRTVHVYRLVTEGTVEERMIERAEKKLYLDKMVNRDSASAEMADESEDSGKLMATLKFGCNCVFGQGADKNRLPTDADIAAITDRNRTEEYSTGSLKGGADASAKDFDATKELTESTAFGGIDFKKIRAEYQNSKKPDTIGHISDIWKKRQRKNRIKMIESKNSGYGSKAIPVLAANDYDLQSGERSVFQQELRGRPGDYAVAKKKKAGPTFDMQDHCQLCGDGGFLVGCPRCPVSLHLKCAGLTHEKQFQCCSHHSCVVCQKPGASVGGFMFPCSACPNSFCEDHLPKEARFLESCERMEDLGFMFKHGVYIHCSKQCEEVAIDEFGYKPPGIKIKPPCPPDLDLSSHFGGQVDDSVEAPEDYVVTGKRSRKMVNYAQSGSQSPEEPNAYTGVPNDWFHNRQGKRTKENEEPWDSKAAQESDDDDDDEIEFLRVSSQQTAHAAKKAPPSASLFHRVPGITSQQTAHASRKAPPDGSQVKRAPQPAYLTTMAKPPPKITAPTSAAQANGAPPSAVQAHEYIASLPVMVSGPTPTLLIDLTFHEDGSTRFAGYRTDSEGRKGPAELDNTFRGLDMIVAVDGQPCEGMSHHEVFDLLKVLDGKKRKILRMRPVYE